MSANPGTAATTYLYPTGDWYPSAGTAPASTIASTGWSGNYGYQAFSFIQVGDKLYRMNPYTGQCWQLTYDIWKLIQEPKTNG